MVRKRGVKYTKEQAEQRFPIVLKRIALSCVECMSKLDTYPINSYEIESEVYTIKGLCGHLVRLAHVVYREAALSKLVAEEAE